MMHIGVIQGDFKVAINFFFLMGVSGHLKIGIFLLTNLTNINNCAKFDLNIKYFLSSRIHKKITLAAA